MHRQHDYLFNASWKRPLLQITLLIWLLFLFFSLESPAWMTAIIVTVIVFVALLFLSVCLAKRIKRRNREAAERFPMAIVSRRTPSEPVSTNADIPPPDYPYPLESPPPYPVEEQIPQFPPPGQSYPWQQSTPAEESVTHENSWRFFDDFNPVLRSRDKLKL